MYYPHEALQERALTTINGVVMSVVYVTNQPTFTGVIGAMSTLAPNSQTEDVQPPTNTRFPSNTPASSSTTQHNSIASSSLSSFSQNTLLTATTPTSVPSHFSSTSNPFTFSSAAASPGPSDSSDSSTPSSGGMTTGAQIGLAAGVICGIGFIAAMILLVLARKRKQQQQAQSELESEKRALASQPPVAASTRAASPDAPRLSLRPISSLAPEFIGSKQRNRTSQGNMLTTINEGANTRGRGLSPSPINSQGARPQTGDNPFRDPENPFADPEKQAGTHVPMTNLAPVISTPVSPVSTSTIAPAAGAASEQARDHRSSGPSPESFPIPQSQNHSQPPQNGVVAANPRSSPPTTYAELPGAPSPTVAQGPGPELPQGNVYRILMDFRPTMDDELELRAGQLVRLLLEYDDGWALCIRLDRSQQGVVPRSCLAAKPSKPRPGPPPMGPSSRPITPQGRPRGPPGPQGPNMTVPSGQPPSQTRAPSPAALPSNTGAFNQAPRPLSPGPRPQQPRQRSKSPGPYGASGPQPMVATQQKRRSNSVGAANVRNKRNSPPGPSKLGPGIPPVTPDSPGLAL